MKDTIRNTVKEVYNTNVNNFESNASVSWSPSLFDSHVSETKKVVGDYPRNTNSVNNNNNVNSRIKDINHSSANSNLLFFLFLCILLLTAGACYYYRKDIMAYLNKIFGVEKTISKDVVKIKENDEELKETKTVTEKKDKLVEKDKMTIKKDGEIVVDNKIVKESKKKEPKKEESKPKNNGFDKSKYSQNQFVSKDDTYCYIGHDDNMRQCIQVFKDDVCTSGDIFNRIDECLVPQKK